MGRHPKPFTDSEVGRRNHDFRSFPQQQTFGVRL
jgi:hypothetical protein